MAKRGFTVIMRELPKSFLNCLRENPSLTIDLKAARAEHHAYVEALRDNPAVKSVVVLPTQDEYPDSVNTCKLSILLLLVTLFLSKYCH
jgi:hypothetical protein